MTNYLITMKDGWKPGKCSMCNSLRSFCRMAFEDAGCPLYGAREAVECNIHIQRDKDATPCYVAVIKDGFKLYSVEEGK